MSNADPTFHQTSERRMIEHVMRLIGDPRMVLDTARGRRSITLLERNVARGNREIEIKRLMSELNVPDRALQERMPAGEAMDVTLRQRKLWILRPIVGHLRVTNLSPVRELILRQTPQPMTAAQLENALRQLPPPIGRVPITQVIVSTSGFAPEARKMAQRTAQQTLILAEPNDSGGWSIFAPPEAQALAELLNPEAADERRQRIFRAIDDSKVDLVTAGISADRLAAKLQLPAQLVETEVKSYAKQNAGLVAKKINGRFVLFREGTTAVPSAGVSAGGSFMPLVDKIRALFSRKGETEKKIAFLSERRTALSQQREGAYEEITALESKDDQLRDQFKNATAPLTKRRITSQLLQLRKDIERRQQMITVLNQQVNVVSTHLHNLELTQQGQTAQLPDSEEIASDAAAAEEMIAQLQADTELADSVSGVAATGGMSEEELALYEELEKESGRSVSPSEVPDVAPSSAQQSRAPDAKTQAEPKRRAEPEAG